MPTIDSPIAQSVERRTVNPQVAGSSPARGAMYINVDAGVAQLVEHLTCNQGVASSNPAAGTSYGNPR